MAAVALLSCATGATAAPGAAYVVDAKTGEPLYTRDADAPRYPASLTKMMTLYIVFDMIEQKRLSYSSTIRITEHAASRPPSNLELPAGSTITVRDAVLALITKSANDVAAAVGENLAGSEEKFARIMTWKARQLGMKNTTFRNASGLPDPQQITTAHDMGILAVRLVHDFPEHYKLFATRQFTHNGQTHSNHNTLLRTYEGTDGIKTGYTRSSGFNLVASVRRGNKHVIGVVLGGRSAGDRNSQMRALIASALGKAKALDNSLIARRPTVIAEQRKTPPVNEVAAVRAPAVTSKPATSPIAATVASTVATRPPTHTLVTTAVASERTTLAAPKAQPKATQGPFQVQVGAYVSQAEAEKRLLAVANTAAELLKGHAPITTVIARQSTQVHRARFAGFDEAKAQATCQGLKQRSIDCIVMRAE